MSNIVYAHVDIEADGPSPLHNNMLSIGIVMTNGEGQVLEKFLGDMEPIVEDVQIETSFTVDNSLASSGDILPGSTINTNAVKIDDAWTVETPFLNGQKTTFSIPGNKHKADERTMQEFWSKNSDELQRIRKNARPVNEVMAMIDSMLRKYRDSGKKVKWVARPAAYDWQWLNCYYSHYSNTHLNASPLGFKAVCLSTMRDVYKMITGMTDDEMKEWIDKNIIDEAMTHNALDDAMFQAKVFHLIHDTLNGIKVCH